MLIEIVTFEVCVVYVNNISVIGVHLGWSISDSESKTETKTQLGIPFTIAYPSLVYVCGLFHSLVKG